MNVIAPDSFKGSLDSIQASEIMRKAILAVKCGLSGKIIIRTNETVNSISRFHSINN